VCTLTGFRHEIGGEGQNNSTLHSTVERLRSGNVCAMNSFFSSQFCSHTVARFSLHCFAECCARVCLPFPTPHAVSSRHSITRKKTTNIAMQLQSKQSTFLPAILHFFFFETTTTSRDDIEIEKTLTTIITTTTTTTSTKKKRKGQLLVVVLVFFPHAYSLERISAVRTHNEQRCY
jgi:hypothetical protein